MSAAMLLPTRSTLGSASRVAGIAAPLDGVSVDTTDADAVAAAAGWSRLLGLSGTCVLILESGSRS